MKEKVYKADYNNPAPAFAKDVKEQDLKNLGNKLQAADTCHYFQGLLESQDYQPYEYNEFLDELPSKRAFTDANSYASQLYNANIRESILKDITIPDFAEVCKHIPSQEHAQYTKNTLVKTKEQMLDIECNTRGQSDSKLWFQERQARLTASNFGSVMKRRENIFPKSLLTKMLTPATNGSKPPEPCLWGKTNEQTAIAKYLEDKQSLTACVQCGLIINTEAPWLGASPDCLLHDASETTPFGVGEVKCPFSKKEMTIEDACEDSSFFLTAPSNDKQTTGTPTLKRNHQYYYQLQGLMATCKVKWGDFIVYTKQDIFSERIYFDHELWYKTMLPKLTLFYFTYIYPKLVK
jgi:hypothetical protein